MAQGIQRSRGRPAGYKFDRGGIPTEFGPFIGIVTNNIDPTRSGRLQVWIEQFGATNSDGSPNLEDESTWRTVAYVPPFYGVTPHSGTNQGAGTFKGNQQSYGMWFTPPDLGTQVMCFFAGGDPNQGFYTGCVPEPGIAHMLPAIGASTKYNLDKSAEDQYLSGARQLPVTEVNNENEKLFDDPRFFDQPKPVHSMVAGVMFQQGLIKDVVRGPITSNAQRESPSAVFGISTPGKPIYQGGLNELDIKNQLERGAIKPQDIVVEARRGGHSIVMDDGDLEGKDTLVRIRTAKGHQITMSDDGDCFYIIHANGQTWIELGKQGTVDVFSTNSVNVRTQGTINLHADKDINMFAGGAINVKSKTLKMESDASIDLIGTAKLTLYSKNLIGIRSDGSLALKNTSAGSWDGGGSLTLSAGCINLNSGAAAPVEAPTNLKDFSLSDTKFVAGSGWTVEYGTLKTIVTRAPTHEPYPYHNQGVSETTTLGTTPATDLNEATATTLARLDDVPVAVPMDSSTFLAQAPAEISVGSLNTTQVTGLMAQTAAEINQPIDTISADTGIGKFGFTPTQLEGAGFLKPGTVQTFLQNPSQITSILSSPAVWTGKSGVNNLTGLLTNSSLQDVTQNEIMVSSLDGLRQLGIVTGNETPADLASFVQTASRFGVNDTVAWVKGLAPPDLVNQFDSVAKGAQSAINFVDTRADDLTTGSIQIPGYTNTVNRADVDLAVEEIIGDSKIPLPDYSSSLYSNVPSGDLEYDAVADATTIERIDAERESRGLPPIETYNTNDGNSVTYSEAGNSVNQRILALETQLSTIEASINFRQKRGLDLGDLRIQAANLEAQIALLRQA